MKKTTFTLRLPETIGLAIVGAVVGASLSGASAHGVTLQVLAGGLIGAAAPFMIFLALRHRFSRPASRVSPPARG